MHWLTKFAAAYVQISAKFWKPFETISDFNFCPVERTSMLKVLRLKLLQPLLLWLCMHICF